MQVNTRLPHPTRASVMISSTFARLQTRERGLRIHIHTCLRENLSPTHPPIYLSVCASSCTSIRGSTLPHTASANRDRKCNPLRLREELLRKRSRKERDSSRFRDKKQNGSASSGGFGAGSGAPETGEGSKLIVGTLLPRLAGERHKGEEPPNRPLCLPAAMIYLV